MSRRTFNILAVFVWIGLFVAASCYFEQLITLSQQMLPDLGSNAFPVVAFAAIIVGLALHGLLADRYAPRIPPSEKDLTEAQKRERARREATLAIKQGRTGSAMLIYEQAGMYREALKLAEELNDQPGLARISVRLGHHKRARRIYLRLKDYEAAGHTSALMGEIDTAREFYRQAAEATGGKASDLQEAGLWERAGELGTAAGLYETALELEHAAECYRLLGDMRAAVRCEEHAKLTRALEQKQHGERVLYEEQKAAQEKANAVRQAKELETIGDFLGAGILYRKGEQLLDAARAFERFEEWERAADAYEQGGLKDRAALVRMHVEAKHEILEDDLSAQEAIGARSAPMPTAGQPVAFVPIERAQAVPVYIGVSGAPPISPEARLEVCRRVRRGNFLEAAEFAKSAGDWVMAAAYYEHAGMYLASADIYRQIGDLNAAIWCLGKAGRHREAAFLTLAIGQNERAVEGLLKAIEDGKNVEENVMALGELLLQIGRHAQALAMVRKMLVPAGISATNAEIFYQFARRLEERKAWKEAHAAYEQLLAAGVKSEDIEERQARLSGMVRLAKASEAAEEVEPGEPDTIDAMLNVAFQEFAGRLEAQRQPAPAGEGGTKILRLPFEAKSPLDVANVPVAGASGTFLFAGQELSLFGHAVGDPSPSESAAEGAAGPGDDQGDPFAPSRRYEIKSELGRGGMGVVYETVDTILGRRVALKLILNEAANPEGYEQFLVEARAIALLSHPNVVVIYDVGLMGLQHYIAMEFVGGGSLSSLVDKHQAMPLKEALRLFIEMSRGLQAAHEAGIVHRDVKPANVLLTEDREVKLADFGLAKMRRTTDGKREATATEVSGTPGFMAPEQIHGAEVHPGFDIYSLGITLFALLVGKPPHGVANKTSLLEIVQFQESGELIPLRRYRPNAPDAIEQIYRYCTEVDPKNRYQSISQFLPSVEEIYNSL